MSEIANRPQGEIAVLKAEYFFDKLGLSKEWEREKGFALQAIQGNDTLSKCNPQSIIKAVANVALTGLTLDPSRKLAFLIPRSGQCVLQPSYRGLIKSVTSTGTVIAFEAKVVYKGDSFEFQEGSDPFIRHNSLDLKEFPTDEEIQLLTARERNPFSVLRCAYSVAILPNNVRTFVIMPKWRIEKIKAVAKGTDKPSSPWNKWPEEQIRKTVLAYHTKTLDVGESAAATVQLFHDNDGMNASELNGEKKIPTLDDNQIALLESLADEVGANPNAMSALLGYRCLEDIPADKYDQAVSLLEGKRK